VIFSHGNGGSFGGHSDTAAALAEAGFVVAAVTHTGDNFQDQSYAGQLRWFAERSRHVQHVVDYMLTDWSERERLDRDQVGFFGFSMGGFTGLVAAGAMPDLTRIKTFCAKNPSDFVCRLLLQIRSEVLLSDNKAVVEWRTDPRIKAAVLAAPGFPYAFSSEAIAAIKVPVQLWTAEYDDRVPGGDASQLRDSLGMVEYHRVPNAGHFAFLPPCSFSAELCTDAPGFDRAKFHSNFNSSIVNFFQETLKH
jgi:predicted dienelactone hydrolase